MALHSSLRFDCLCNTEISFQLFKQPVYLGLLFFIGLL